VAAMNCISINLDALEHNIRRIEGWIAGHGASWTLVTKVLCGHQETLAALAALGLNSFGDSRLRNIAGLPAGNFETWYLRLPHHSVLSEIVAHCAVSLNSELSIMQALNDEAGRQGKTHRAVIMIELGDLREGILPGHLLDFYRRCFELPNLEITGIGANLGCLSGAVPGIDQLMQLALYHELLELKFERELPLISAASSSALPQLLKGEIPPEVNHFRIGEAVFLGTDLLNGGLLPGLRGDAFTIEAEIVEIKEKSLTPSIETSDAIRPFDDLSADDDIAPGQRGWRALVAIGQLDTDIAGLTPANSGYRISGASSDLTVVNIGGSADGLRVGASLKFIPNYVALLRAMGSQYLPKQVYGALREAGA
jgi:ornithine racemase